MHGDSIGSSPLYGRDNRATVIQWIVDTLGFKCKSAFTCIYDCIRVRRRAIFV